MKRRVAYYVEKMKKSKIYGLAVRHPRRTEFLLVSLFFGAFAAIFMGPILFHFGSAVHGFWGDGTGGLIWLNGLHLPPFGGHTDAVLYPLGENLFRPDLITSAFFVAPFWLAAKFVGGVAAWNLTIFVAYWLCGVSMYYLVKRLVKNRLAALWAGVAFTFMPMHQYKAFGHIAYELTFIFVFVLWQVLNFLERPSRRNAILLGLAFTVPFYIDGYYVLFTLVLVGVPLMYMIAKRAWGLNKKTVDDFKAFIRSLVIFGVTSIVALLPIIYVKLVYGAQIAASLTLARGDFMGNVKVYTGRWYDYILPIQTHPVFGKWVTDVRLTHNHGSNPSEYTLYLGFVLLGLVGWFAYWLWRQRKAPAVVRKLTGVKPEVILVVLLTTVVAFSITLQPYFNLLGHKVPLPSGVISVFVQYWRVYARLILLVQMLLVIIGAMGLVVLLKRFRSKVGPWALVALLILVTFFEYLSFNPFHRQDIWYYSKISSANRWLAQQKDIKVIAVYPLVDEPNGLASLYTTEQQVNGKKMINAGSITTTEARLRASIGGLRDPQTLPVLKALGVQAVMTHEMGISRPIAGLHLAYRANEMPAGYAADVDVFTFDNVPAAQYALVAQSGFNDLVYTDSTSKHYVNGSTALLGLEAMPGAAVAPDGMYTVNFELGATAGYQNNDIVLTQDNHIVDVIHMAAGEQRQLSYQVRGGSSLQVNVVGQLNSNSLYVDQLQAN